MQVTVNIPGTPKNAEVEVPGLGVFLNGGKYVVEDTEAVETFYRMNPEHPRGKALVFGERLPKDTKLEMMIEETPEPEELIDGLPTSHPVEGEEG